jgi:PAS domain S-box-containing protein
MSVVRIPDETRQGAAPPDATGNRLAVLLALVNVPAALLLGWLVLGWLSPAVAGRPNLGRLIGLAGVAGALGVSFLIYRIAVRTSARLRESLRVSSAQGRALRAVLEAAADGILTVDEAGRITSCNPAGGWMFGYSVEELIGQPLTFVLPGALGSLSNEVGTGEHRILGAGRTIEARRKDGSRFPVSLGLSKMRVDGRGFYTLIVHDLTEMKRARHAAEAASRTRSSFLARLSHEVRTPLGGILGMTELLRDTHLSDEQRRRLDTIQQSAEAVLAVFAQVIDFAQLEAGEVVIGERGFSLRDLLRQALAPFAPVARGKGLRLKVEMAPDLPDRLRGDPLRLGQVLASLVGNAIKFTESGEVVVRVSSAACGLAGPSEEGTAKPQAAEEAVTLHFEVRDSGIGIPRDKLASIFEPFEQADTSSTRKHGGVGLGLSLAARLVELMGGQIEVDSRPGRGSTFRFGVALEQDSETMPADPGAVMVALASSEELRALESQLTAWGFRVVGAPTGSAALAELMRAGVAGDSFALVLIAEHLPDLSAREMLRRLRGRLDSPPPAILLGHSEKDQPAPAGFAAVLSRPVAALELRQAIRQVLASSRLSATG